MPSSPLRKKQGRPTADGPRVWRDLGSLGAVLLFRVRVVDSDLNNRGLVGFAQESTLSTTRRETFLKERCREQQSVAAAGVGLIVQSRVACTTFGCENHASARRPILGESERVLVKGGTLISVHRHHVQGRVGVERCLIVW